MEEADAILKQIYYDPKTGHTGAQQLWSRARSKAPNLRISLAKVQAWLKEQQSHQTFAPNGLDKKPNWFKITDVPNSYAVDAIIKDAYKNKNKGYRGFLLFIELTTRKAYAYPFKSGDEKSPPNKEESLEIFKRFEAERMEEKHPVARISGDNGKEFDNKDVQDFLYDKHIMTYFHRPEDHRANGILNVAVRYIRRIVERDIEEKADIYWLDKLQDAVENWNSHVIMPLKSSPDTLWDDKRKRQNVRLKALIHNKAVWKKHEFHDNDIVKRYLRRNTKGKGLFNKEGANWEGEYKVIGRKGWSYQLQNDKGEELDWRGRPYELQRLAKSHTFGKEEEPEKPQAAAKRADRVRRLVNTEVGKGAAERIVREKRKQVKPDVMNVEATVPKQRAPRGSKVRQLKGTMVRTVERVLEHRRLKGAIELKVKWAHLSEAESLALGWSPLSNFYEIDSEGDRVYNPIVAKYLDEKDIDTDDEA